MSKIQIPINSVDCNLYHDLLSTELCIVKNEGTDSEYLEFAVLDPRKSTLVHLNSKDIVLIHKDQTSLTDFIN